MRWGGWGLGVGAVPWERAATGEGLSSAESWGDEGRWWPRARAARVAAPRRRAAGLGGGCVLLCALSSCPAHFHGTDAQRLVALEERRQTAGGLHEGQEGVRKRGSGLRQTPFPHKERRVSPAVRRPSGSAASPGPREEGSGMLVLNPPARSGVAAI